MESIVKAVDSVVGFLGMAPCEKSAKVAEDKNSHALYLSVSILREKTVFFLLLALLLIGP